MKTFYEMIKILESVKSEGYHYEGPEHDERDISYSLLVGEDEGSPCSCEIDGENNVWEPRNGIFIADYVPNGTENPITKPKYYKPGSLPAWPSGGTDFDNPGEGLKNLPNAPAIERCEKFIEDEINRYFGSYDPKKGADHGERPERAWDDQDQAAYDRSLWLGGEKY
jgi:hypothetical protein